MKKNSFALFSLATGIGAILLCSGCTVGGAYVEPVPLGAGSYYGDYGSYAGPYYGDYGPYYGGTAVVIGGGRGYRRGYSGGHHLYGGRGAAFRGTGGGFGGRGFAARPGGGGFGRGPGSSAGARAGGSRR